jgi:hypothetical protein
LNFVVRTEETSEIAACGDQASGDPDESALLALARSGDPAAPGGLDLPELPGAGGLHRGSAEERHDSGRAV